MRQHFFLYIIFSLYSLTCQGTDYYVSNNGNDLNDGLSNSTTFETLQHAADIVAPGDQGLVADGTYTGFAL